MENKKSECYSELVVASGARNKLDAARKAYGSFAIPINEIDPERATGRKESDDPYAGKVAYEKAKAIVDTYDVDWRYLVIAGDVCTWVWKEGGEKTELKKAIRLFDPEDKNAIADAVSQAQVEARALYCNGKFYVMWHIGIVLLTSDLTFSRGAVVECTAEFSSGIPMDIVSESTSTEKTLYDSTYINLAKRVREYGSNMLVRNLGDDSEGKPISAEFIDQAASGCVLPSAFFSQLTSTSLSEGQVISREGFEQVKLDF